MLFWKLKGIIYILGQNDSLLKGNYFKESQSYFRTFEHFVHTKTRNKLEPPGTSWNYLQQAGHRERAGTTWSELEPREQAGTSLSHLTYNEMNSATKWRKKKKLIGRNYASNTIAQ